MKKYSAIFLAVALVFNIISFTVSSQNAKTNTETDLAEYFYFNNLSELENDTVSRQISSFDGSGSNNDSLALQGYDNNSKDVVLLDTKLPGVVSRMWFTGNEQARVKFYFNGETTPRINKTIAELTSGSSAPFLKPLVGNALDSSGGYYCYVPIAYEQSLIITGDGICYYNINYNTYSKSKNIVTFTGKEDVTNLVNILKNTGIDPKTSFGTNEETSLNIKLDAGTTSEIFRSDKAGGIASVKLDIPDLYPDGYFNSSEDGRAYTGYSQFTAEINPANTGIRICKTVNSKVLNQTVNIKIDGVSVGHWVTAQIANNEYPLCDYYFDIPLNYTEGKSKITITSEFISANPSVNEFEYVIYSKTEGLYTETDRLNVGPLHIQEEASHNYVITQQQWEGSVSDEDGMYRDKTPVDKRTFQYSQDGRAYTGYSQFVISIDPDNNGITLKKLIDGGIPGQKVKIYADGKYVGIWDSSSANTTYRWNVQTFNIPSSYTENKNSITIKSEMYASALDINEFWYEAYSITDGKEKLTDKLDIGLNHRADENAHSYIISNETWRGANSFSEFIGNQFSKPESSIKTENLINNVWLEAYFDNESEPSVNAPIGSLFGIGNYGIDEGKSIMIGADDTGVLYFYYTMPYSKSCVIKLKNLSDYDISQMKSTVIANQNLVLTKNEGYFKTQYNDYSVSKDGYFTALDTNGSGHIVGIVQSEKGVLSRGYLEGDEVFYVDGSLDFSGQGTGTEDIYNGAWYFQYDTFSTPFTSNMYHDMTDSCDRTAMMRIYLSDRITFRNGIKYVIEDLMTGVTPKTSCQILCMYYQKDNSSIILTDTIDFSDVNMVTAHNYTNKESQPVSNTKYYQSYYKRTKRLSEGFEVKESSMTVNISGKNNGIILQRDFFHASGEAAAEVYVDGNFAGIWTTEYSKLGESGYTYAAQDTFIIAAEFTQDKSSVVITFKAVGNSAWQDYKYNVFSLTESVIYGDVNLNGVINASDALIVLQASVSKITLNNNQEIVADVDGNKEISANDALLILQYSVKRISAFPADMITG